MDRWNTTPSLSARPLQERERKSYTKEVARQRHVAGCRTAIGAIRRVGLLLMTNSRGEEPRVRGKRADQLSLSPALQRRSNWRSRWPMADVIDHCFMRCSSAFDNHHYDSIAAGLCASPVWPSSPPPPKQRLQTVCVLLLFAATSHLPAPLRRLGGFGNACVLSAARISYL